MKKRTTRCEFVDYPRGATPGTFSNISATCAITVKDIAETYKKIVSEYPSLEDAKPHDPLTPLMHTARDKPYYGIKTSAYLANALAAVYTEAARKFFPLVGRELENQNSSANGNAFGARPINFKYARPQDAQKVGVHDIALRPLDFKITRVRVFGESVYIEDYWSYTPSDAACVFVEFTVPDRKTGEPLKLAYTHKFDRKLLDDAAAVAAEVREACRRAFTHEVDEMLYLGEERFIEPHPESMVDHRRPLRPNIARALEQHEKLGIKMEFY